MFLMNAFNKMAHDLGRPMTAELLFLGSAKLLRVYHPDVFREGATRLMDRADAIGDAYPDLALKMASCVAAMAASKQHSITNDAVEMVLDYAEAAYPIDPDLINDSLTGCWCATQNKMLRRRLEWMAWHLEPAMKPGPWGLREEGIALTEARMNRKRPLLRRLDWYIHDKLHPIAPEDLFVP